VLISLSDRCRLWVQRASRPRRRKGSQCRTPAVESLEVRLLLTGHNLPPATVVVDVAHDVTATDGFTTFREGVQWANANFGSDVLRFSLPVGTQINLTQPYPVQILDDLTIDGPGQSTLSIHGGPYYDILHVGSGITVTIQDITLISSGYGTIESDADLLTITDSTIRINPQVTVASDSNIVNRLGDLTIERTWIEGIGNNTISQGGGIYHTGGGALKITDGSTIHHHNSGVAGGGIYNDRSKVWIDHSTISANSTTSSIDLATGGPFQWPFEEPCDPASGDLEANGAGSGGGLYNHGGQVEIFHSSFTDNRAYFEGGALYSEGVAGTNSGIATVDIETTTMACNRVAFGYGGAISNVPGTGVSLLDLGVNPQSNPLTGFSVFERNVAEEGGGAIFNSSMLGLFNSTISNNRARGKAPMTQGNGGGLYLGVGGSSEIAFVTFAKNEANADGGGLFVEPTASGPVKLTHSLFTVSNSAGTAGTDDIADLAGRIAYYCVNHLRDPVVDQLDFHGGVTRTHKLPPGHPAVNNICWNPLRDQREFYRTDNVPDIGSFELGAAVGPHIF